jgi:hypothetical protein
MEYTYEVTQPATTYFRGEITVQAIDAQDAIDLIKGLTETELEESCTDWELAECGTDANGLIEVWSDNGEQIR